MHGGGSEFGEKERRRERERERVWRHIERERIVICIVLKLKRVVKRCRLGGKGFIEWFGTCVTLQLQSPFTSATNN